MAFFSFSFMGAGPLGALLCGQLVAALGARLALAAACAALMAVVVVLARASGLWNLRGGGRPPAPAA